MAAIFWCFQRLISQPISCKKGAISALFLSGSASSYTPFLIKMRMASTNLSKKNSLSHLWGFPDPHIPLCLLTFWGSGTPPHLDFHVLVQYFKQASELCLHTQPNNILTEVNLNNFVRVKGFVVLFSLENCHLSHL